MINWIITATILTALVITLHYLLRGRVNPRLQYALWGLVLLRLLLPFNIGTTRMSVENTVRQIPPVQRWEALTQPESVPPFQNAEPDADAASPSEAAPVKIPESVIPSAVAAAGVKETAGQMSKTSLTPVRIAYVLWLSGAGIVAAGFLILNLRFALRLRKTRVRLDCSAKLPVYICTGLDSPCLFGVFRPAVYLTPEATAGESVQRHALVHELTHYSHGDHIWAALRCLCLALHWYNPLVWWAAFLSRQDAELACDEATVRRLGESERAEYGRTLLRLTYRKHGGLLTAATTMTGGGIRERILLLAKKPKTAVYTLVAVLLVAALAVGCTFTGAKEDAETPSKNSEWCLVQMVPSTIRMTDALEPADDTLPGTPVSDSELARLKVLFDSDGELYGQAIAYGCLYEKPEEIDLRYFFYNGIPGTEQTLSEAETAYLESVWGKIYTDVTRLPAAEMEKMVQRYFGLPLQEMKGIGLSSMTYWAQTDCYYIQHGDTNRKLLSIYDARVQDDGTINLYYNEDRDEIDRTQPPQMVAVLEPAGDRYYVRTNHAYVPHDNPNSPEAQLQRWSDEAPLKGLAVKTGYKQDYPNVGRAFMEAYVQQFVNGLSEENPMRCKDAVVLACTPTRVGIYNGNQNGENKVAYSVTLAFQPASDSEETLRFFAPHAWHDDLNYPQYRSEDGWYIHYYAQIILERKNGTDYWTCIEDGSGSSGGNDMMFWLMSPQNEEIFASVMDNLVRGEPENRVSLRMLLPVIDWGQISVKWGEEGWRALCAQLENLYLVPRERVRWTEAERSEQKNYDMYLLLTVLAGAERQEFVQMLKTQRAVDSEIFDDCVNNYLTEQARARILTLMQ